MFLRLSAIYLRRGHIFLNIIKLHLIAWQDRKGVYREMCEMWFVLLGKVLNFKLKSWILDTTFLIKINDIFLS